MEVLSKELVQSISYEKTSRVRHPVFYGMLRLQVGEGLQINKEEWDKRTPIGVSVSNFSRSMKGKFKVLTVSGGVGWMIIRTE